MNLCQTDEVLLTISGCLPQMPHISADSDIQEVALHGPAGPLLPDMCFRLDTGTMANFSTMLEKMSRKWHIKLSSPLHRPLRQPEAGSLTATLYPPPPAGGE